MDEHLPPTGASRPARWCLVAALQGEAAAPSPWAPTPPVPSSHTIELQVGGRVFPNPQSLGRSQARYLQVHRQMPTLAIGVRTRGAA